MTETHEKFVVPKKDKRPGPYAVYVRVNLEDREKILKISKETGHSMQVVVEAAVRFALENM